VAIDPHRILVVEVVGPNRDYDFAAFGRPYGLLAIGIFDVGGDGSGLFVGSAHSSQNHFGGSLSGSVTSM
jgi:hypothetical protein